MIPMAASAVANRSLAAGTATSRIFRRRLLPSADPGSAAARCDPVGVGRGAGAAAGRWEREWVKLLSEGILANGQSMKTRAKLSENAMGLATLRNGALVKRGVGR